MNTGRTDAALQRLLECEGWAWHERLDQVRADDTGATDGEPQLTPLDPWGLGPVDRLLTRAGMSALLAVDDAPVDPP